ncbi:MAG: sigma 54-interacting transcriptional regulator [Kofleriaceae bacterium]
MEGVRRFRTGVPDLAALRALPSMWVGMEAAAVIASFLETLVASMYLDLAFMRVADPTGGPALEAVRANDRDVADRAAQIGDLLEPMLGARLQASIPDPLAEGTLEIVVLPLGVSPHDVVVVGSRSAGFPTRFEIEVLASAVDQAARWLRAARGALASPRPPLDEPPEPPVASPVASPVGSAVTSPVTSPVASPPPIDPAIDPPLEPPRGDGAIIGASAVLRQVIEQLDCVAPTDAAVLLLGESGTGKELFAREIHRRSRRADRPLVKVNCSAIPRDMFETEFFGHVRGTFTGAHRDRPGRFLLAEGGTLFLDEIGDLPFELQPKLLRVLQEGQYERVGDDVTRHVDVRVIAATNRDLEAEVAAGRFRGDLYYRLSVFPIQIPPLRARKSDIPALVAHFVRVAAARLGSEPPPLQRDQLAQLKSHDWPGNIRELQNRVERAVILSRGGRNRLAIAVPEREPRRPHEHEHGHEHGHGHEHDEPRADLREVIPEREWRRRERENLLLALQRTGGRIYGPRGAAALLGVKPSTLQSRLRALGIHPDEAP